MNQSETCHQIDGCPNLFVDGFKAFKRKTKHAECGFILSHYHGDHYTGLPRNDGYEGPAIIHCTPITASLLREIHVVNDRFIVEHSYGTTWRFPIKAAYNKYELREKAKRQDVEVTFYDANHCPGAAIIFIKFEDGRSHLHTGDMRYHQKMQSYALLREAALSHSLDIVYLDTTYGHPRHTFMSQENAIDAVASETETRLCTLKENENSHLKSNVRNEKILILLSCYSIGKEKILWEISKRTKRRIYVSEKKHKMIQCCFAEGQNNGQEFDFLHECVTLNKNETNIHCIPMGLAGEVWPYFQPNYHACASYAQDLGLSFDKILAFMPTGWANASNWNKKNSRCQKEIVAENPHTFNNDKFDVEVRLVAYSEHSSFDELCDFVKFLRPRKITPTVFSDLKELVSIEKRLRKFCDVTRAKQRFLESLSTSSSTVDRTSIGLCIENKNCHKMKCKTQSEKDDIMDESVSSRKRPRFFAEPKNLNQAAQTRQRNFVCDKSIALLVDMGFDDVRAGIVVAQCNGDVEQAIAILIDNDSHCPKAAAEAIFESKESNKPPRSSISGSTRRITSYFKPQQKSDKSL